jgi:hypothetical protein
MVSSGLPNGLLYKVAGNLLPGGMIVDETVHSRGDS